MLPSIDTTTTAYAPAAAADVAATWANPLNARIDDGPTGHALVPPTMATEPLLNTHA